MERKKTIRRTDRQDRPGWARRWREGADLWLRDQGMEVIYTGLRQSVEQVVEVALQEAVDVIGVSILSGSHVSIAQEADEADRRARAWDDVLVLFGGLIPKDDIKALKRMGIHGVFPYHILQNSRKFRHSSS